MFTRFYMAPGARTRDMRRPKPQLQGLGLPPQRPRDRVKPLQGLASDLREGRRRVQGQVGGWGWQRKLKEWAGLSGFQGFCPAHGRCGCSLQNGWGWPDRPVSLGKIPVIYRRIRPLPGLGHSHSPYPYGRCGQNIVPFKRS